MKRISVLSVLIATIICLLSGCSRAQQFPANDQPLLPGEKKILIVYLSRTNNRAIAEFIHQKSQPHDGCTRLGNALSR
jgi:hypothetical protein